MPLFVGQFVRSTENDLGTGKVLDAAGNTVTVEYFDSPTDDERETRNVGRASVAPVRLGNNTRVYFFDRERGRMVPGRVTGLSHTTQPPDYLIRTSAKEKLRISETKLLARWRRPIKDPADLLAGRLSGDPAAHECRSRFVASMVEQRAASAGMSGVLSSVIDLEQHQVEVVRRVLRDPVQRYLLADEVGLGKTIETGMIIRQYVLDHPDDHSVLIVVPPHLKEQWLEELTVRFLLGHFLGRSVHLVHTGEVKRIAKLGAVAGMLVVDEAHRLTPNRPNSEQVFSAISEIALRIDRLLLLSATPVLRNEEGFLAMLHLLDPANYDLDDLESFRQRVVKRQAIAEIFHSFTGDNQNFFLKQLAGELQKYFPEDRQLGRLIETALPLLDFGIPQESPERLTAIEAIRIHVSETYRLHRRLLRTRRSKRTQDLLPGRDGLEVARYSDPWEKRAAELIDEWRITAAGEVDGVEACAERLDLARLLHRLFETASSDLLLLADVIRTRAADAEVGRGLLSAGVPEEDVDLIISAPRFAGEEEILAEMLTLLSDGEPGKAKLKELEGVLERLQEKNTKTLIFINTPVTAKRVHSHLTEIYGDTVALHLPSEDFDRDHPEWHRFREDPYCKILICSRESEEGLNLHGGDAVMIHYDLPCSPNRIEQRLGRLDRYGDGTPVRSVVMIEEDAEMMGAWCDCLEKAFRVFERSIASLQYLVEEWQKKLLMNVLTEGVDAVRDSSGSLGGEEGEIEEELGRIRAQDELDAIEVAEADDEGFFERLSRKDADFPSIQATAEGWIVHQMRFVPRQEGGPQSRVLKYRYHYDGRGSDTMVPPEILMENFADAIDQDRPNHHLNPTSHPISYNRATACRRGTHIGRLGEPFISAMVRHTRWDDCGMCFALWRHRPAAVLPSSPALALRFDFIIEGDATHALKTIGDMERITPEAIRRLLDELFPPVYRSIWLDEELSPISDTELRALLSEPYITTATEDGGRDYPMQDERWKAADRHFDPASWDSLCQSARGKAEEALGSQVELEALTRRQGELAEERTVLHVAQLESRLAQLDGKARETAKKQLNLERGLAAALKSGILAPSVRLDSAGAVFISNSDPFREAADA